MASHGSHQVPNVLLVALRKARGLSQQELAEALNRLSIDAHGRGLTLTGKAVYRWETGESASPKPYYGRLLSEFFQVPICELGFVRPQSAVETPWDEAEAPRRSDPPSGVAAVEQRHWLDTRKALGTARRALAITAAQLYSGHQLDGLGQAGVLTCPEWIPAEPVPLQRVRIALDPAGAEPVVSGGEVESEGVRPLTGAVHRYRRYHDAIRDLALPKLFENRLCFRLTGVEQTAGALHLQFGHMGFFDAIDINEAVAHETAEHHLGKTHDGAYVTAKPSWRRLSFRKLIGDPFDLERRTLMGAVGTLTIRGGDSPSVVLHHRDGARVAGGGGMTHLLPAGIFQPSSVLPAAVSADFSLWRTIQREYAEELLGHDEYDGTGRPIAYDVLEPFVTMDRALSDGRIKVWCLGITLDALTLSGDILTAAVIEPDLYDELFAAAVATNAEGDLSARAVPFEANTLRYLRAAGSLSPGAAAALHLAWTHRRHLLS
ncbi:hypothetical protein GCM10027598_62570 [Amycolatopsis oliviviridis]|uniref:HTH cro/C1-type domain-containing protein n=1 Tax=Amycolatopsis oliviviridis TaxID=1471590 RepID=A0ABQ3MAD9_9PSEU|nr:helix-turn-helix transcriptional regulator [Amycolatopsis oliviviridis]GHH32956.1 hypothetical protein GCM10017790_70860 [Amycolatopsis oliviviridis]